MQSDLNRYGFYISPDDLMWMLMGLRIAVTAAEGEIVVELAEHVALGVEPDGQGGAIFSVISDLVEAEEEDGDEQPLFN